MAGALNIFRALADEVRLRILHALLGAELSVAELVQILALPHISELEALMLIATIKETEGLPL